MHLIRRAVFHAAASPAVRARTLSTRVTVSPFYQTAKTQSKLTSITFRRFNSDGARADREGAAVESADQTEQAPVDHAVDAAEWRGTSSPGFNAGSRPIRRPQPELAPTNSIYLGNLQFEVTEKDLEREFAEFGEVKKATLATDPRGLSKGFGYVEFDTVEAATAAIAARNQTILEGRRLVVNYQGKTSRPSLPKNPASKTLFIGNLAFEMSDGDLNKMFRDIRNVIDVRVAIDRRTGQPRGFAHADFTDVESAMTAFDLLQNKEVYGRVLRVDYSASRVPRLGEHRGGDRQDKGEYGNDNGRPSF